MSASKKILCSGAVLLSCLPLSGCAGNRLNNMFSTTSPSDYKTLQQLAEEEREQSGKPAASSLAGIESPAPDAGSTTGERWARFPSWKRDAKDDAKSATVAASSGSEIAESESAESAGPLNRLLTFGGRKKGLETDPFLETDALSASKSAAGSKSAGVQSEMERLAELDRLRELQKNQSLQAAATNQKSLQDSFDDPSEEAVRLFAAATAAKSTTTASTGSKTEAKERNDSKTFANPADELEALLARTDARPKSETTDGKLQLASAKDSPKSGEDYSDMFRALQAGFETPGETAAGKFTTKEKSAAGSSDSTNPFDLLLADSAPAKTVSDALSSRTEKEKSGNAADGSFEDFLKTATTTSHLRKNRQPVRDEVAKSQVLTESEDDVAERLWATQDASAERPNPFEQSGLAEAKPLADEADFPWKSASESSFAARNANDGGQQWWNNTLANSGFNGSAENFRDSSSAARNSAMGGMLTSGSSVSRNPGFEDAPPFNPVSFQTEFDEQSSGAAGVVAAVDTTPVVSVFGQWKLNTFRNWFLLIGGIVVAILLFAPKRTKPMHAISTNTNARN